jgi:hypothetical protein
LDSHLRPRSAAQEVTMGKQKRSAVVLEPDAAGIDIGAEEIYVAVPPDRDEESTANSIRLPGISTRWQSGLNAVASEP